MSNQQIHIGPPKGIRINGELVSEFTQYIGKNIKILTNNDNHPKIKFEKVLPHPEYECWFDGILEKLILDSRAQDLFCVFSSVDFEGRKKNKKKKEWNIYTGQIIKWIV